MIISTREILENTFQGGDTINQNLALLLANYDFKKSLLGGHGTMQCTVITILRYFKDGLDLKILTFF